MDEEEYLREQLDKHKQYHAMPFAPWQTDLLYYATVNYNLKRLNNLAIVCWERNVSGEILICLNELKKFDAKVNMIAETIMKDLKIENPVIRREKVLDGVHLVFRRFR